MSSYKELTRSELNHFFQPSDFSFSTTEQVKGANTFLGQEEALESIKRGLMIQDKNYHLYICQGEHSDTDEAILSVVKRMAHMKKKAKAIGYLYNFDKPNEPICIEVSIDIASALKDDLEELRNVLLKDLPVLLDGSDVKKSQKEIINDFEVYKASVLSEISEMALEKHFKAQLGQEGIKFSPLNENNQPMDLSTYEGLSTDLQDVIGENLEYLQEVAYKAIEKINAKEDACYELYEEVKYEYVLKKIGSMMKHLKNKYASYEEIVSYWNHVAEDLLNHVAWLALSEGELKQAKKELPTFNEIPVEQLVKHYDVNWLTIPESLEAPVVCDTMNMEMSLSGKVLMSTDNGVPYSDYSMLRPGLLHKAQHGYLIMHMETLVRKPNMWQMLKNMLVSGQIRFETSEETIGFVNTVSPRSLKSDIKLILIGSEEVYQLLKNYDEVFKRFFKIKVTMNDEINATQPNVEQLAQMISYECKKQRLPHVTTEGLLRMIAYSSRKLGSPKRFHSHKEFFIDLLREAKLHGKRCVDAQDIEAVIKAREQSERLLQTKVDETILDTTYMIDTKGKKVGQINGLAVYTVGEVPCGKPIKITATTYRGQMGIVDIEETAQLSGSLHTKGVHIITGFLGYYFAQDFPLAVNGNICIEQNYGLVDGDSASSAELYAVLSSLSEMPIMQHLAVTGSMNQFGEVQPIGGVNEKIEGFFNICKARGLEGNEGVIIPKQNVSDLMLDRALIDTIEAGLFHIYPVESIWEGAELLMGIPVEELKKKIYEKLKKYSQ